VMVNCSRPMDQGGYGRADELNGIAFSSVVNKTIAVTGGLPIHTAVDSENLYNFLASGTAGTGLAPSGEPFVYPTMAFYFTFADVVDMYLMSMAEYIIAPVVSSFNRMAQCLSHHEQPPTLVSLSFLKDIDRSDVRKRYVLKNNGNVTEAVAELASEVDADAELGPPLGMTTTLDYLDLDHDGIPDKDQIIPETKEIVPDLLVTKKVGEKKAPPVDEMVGDASDVASDVATTLAVAEAKSEVEEMFKEDSIKESEESVKRDQGQGGKTGARRLMNYD